MVARSLAVIAIACLVSCERLSPNEVKLVGSWETRTSPESATIFTFEPNHTEWCVVSHRQDTWLDGTGRWHIEGAEIVFEDAKYPKVAPDIAAKDPDLANRPQYYRASFEQLEPDTVKLNKVTLTRTKRPAKPDKPAPFSP
jgi:hypothetical protein